MPIQSLTLRTEGGASRPAEGDLTVYSDGARVARATAFIVGGIVGGGACIIIPLLHFITTWALPLIGILAGLHARRVRVKIYEIKGVCPACEQPIEILPGSAGDGPIMRPCPRCSEPLEIVLEPGEGSDDPGLQTAANATGGS